MSDIQDEDLSVLVPNTALDAPDLTPDKIKLALVNHAMVLQKIAEAVHDQQLTVTTLLYTMALYMRQYPLALEDEAETPDIPVQPGQYL